MKRLFIILFSMLWLAGCGVTETGNPCPGGECGELAGAPSSAEQNVYENATYGVRITYPSDWSVAENAAGDSATFTSSGAPATSAVVTFTRLDPPPASLPAYLAQQYPSQQFNVCNTTSLSGFCFNDPGAGPSGGDAADFFFLNIDVLVHVQAEIFTSGEAQFYELLNGLSFL